jgi:hypothetical protein
MVTRRFALQAEARPAHRFQRSMNSPLDEIMVRKATAMERATARTS